ncbi:MAG: hypothetical protein KUG77_00235 [Nannocystaceae bacterium]|nr:hypothetical protein [Nannocystaceae bacterium]
MNSWAVPWLAVGLIVVPGCENGGEGGNDASGGGAATGSTLGPAESSGTETGATTTSGVTSGDAEDTTGDGTGSSGDPPTQGVPMFVALGQGGRRLMSCDDGQSWGTELVIETNDDDHGPYSSRDVASGQGTFLLGMGWGNPARISASANGIDWQETFPPPDYIESRGLSGIAFGSGRFVAIVGSDSWTSDDLGQSWSLSGQVPTGDNIRVVTHSRFGDGLYYAAADGGLIYQSTDGVSWTDPLPTTGSCDGGNLSRRGGIADHDGTFVLVSDTGNVCRSDDGGSSFTHHTIGEGTGEVDIQSDVIATDEGFYVGGRNGGWHSAQGTQWSIMAFSLDGDDIATVAHSSASGTLIGIARNGDDFYRSTDTGRTWVRADAPPGNDTNAAAFGFATASSDCPG